MSVYQSMLILPVSVLFSNSRESCLGKQVLVDVLKYSAIVLPNRGKRVIAAGIMHIPQNGIQHFLFAFGFRNNIWSQSMQAFIRHGQTCMHS